MGRCCNGVVQKSWCWRKMEYTEKCVKKTIVLIWNDWSFKIIKDIGLLLDNRLNNYYMYIIVIILFNWCLVAYFLAVWFSFLPLPLYIYLSYLYSSYFVIFVYHLGAKSITIDAGAQPIFQLIVTIQWSVQGPSALQSLIPSVLPLTKPEYSHHKPNRQFMLSFAVQKRSTTVAGVLKLRGERRVRKWTRVFFE